MSVEYANKVQIFFTLAKLLALAIIIVGGIVRLGQGQSTAHALSNSDVRKCCVYGHKGRPAGIFLHVK